MKLSEEIGTMYWLFDAGDSRRTEVLKMVARCKALEESKETLLGALRMLTDATSKLAPYSPDVAEAVVAIVDIARATIAKAEGES
jgi:hypothetical protein